MKNYLKKILPPKIFAFIRDIFYPEKINVIEDRLSSLYLTYYQNLAAPGFSQKTAFKNAEFKVYSKHGGDGLLAYIFSKIGITTHTFVEMGVEDGRECNTANLSRNFGWRGLLIDANAEWIKSAQEYYKNYRVKAVTSFITAENINQLLLDNGAKGEIDFLSIDIDGNDYWVWKALTAINPRVVVVEYNPSFGMKSLAVKYNADFRYQVSRGGYPLYFGASLPALSKLAKSKGYILVGCDSHGHDAFFVRRDSTNGKFMELSSEEAFYPNPYILKTIGSIETQYELIKHLKFERV